MPVLELLRVAAANLATEEMLVQMLRTQNLPAHAGRKICEKEQ